MIDYHCHLLPGLDDGAADRGQALAMARQLAEFGFQEVCCTPHCIKGQYEYSPVEVRDAVRSLQQQLDLAGIPLRLQAGMEYYLDGSFEHFVANLLPLGETRLVLCEAPPQLRPEVLVAMLELIVVQGFQPLVAHPERSDSVYRVVLAGATAGTEADRHLAADAAGTADSRTRPRSWLARWFGRRSARTAPRSAEVLSGHDPTELPDGCLLQANLGSFTGYYDELLQRGAYDCLASDLHDADSAGAILDPAREKITFNPALQKLAAFTAPHGAAGNQQMAFW
jgi:protein-tyrosine phosphatase